MTTAHTISREDQIWDFYYLLLEKFVDREGHCDVPKNHMEKGFALGIWVHRQRTYKSALKAKQLFAMESINGWHWIDNNRKRHPAENFRETTSRHLTPETAPAGLLKQRPAGKARDIQNKPTRRTIVSIDTANRVVQREIGDSGNVIAIRKGDTVDFRKSLSEGISKEDRPSEFDHHVSHSRFRTKTEERWERAFFLLLQYGEREGHHSVPARHTEDGFALGRWVRTQRDKLREKPGSRHDRLNSLPGWKWDGLEFKWNSWIKLLVQFVAREGHSRVPKRHIEQGKKLGIWVEHQKEDYSCCELAFERIAQLETFPEWEWRTNGQDLSKIDDDNLAQDIWNILFGEGPISEIQAAHTAVRSLNAAGVLKARTARVGSPIRKKITDALSRCMEWGIMDRPTEGTVRAILPKPGFYEDEDWDMCIEAVIDNPPFNREITIPKAALWAKDNLGLEIAELSPGHIVWDNLESALDRALNNSESGPAAPLVDCQAF